MEHRNDRNFIEVEKADEMLLDSITDELMGLLSSVDSSHQFEINFRDEYEKIKQAYANLQSEMVDVKRKNEMKDAEVARFQARVEELVQKLDVLKQESQNYRSAATVKNELDRVNLELIDREREAAVLRGTLSGIQKTVYNDVEAWKNKSIELMNSLTDLEKKNQFEMATMHSKTQIADEKINYLQHHNQALESHIEILKKNVAEVTHSNSLQIERNRESSQKYTEIVTKNYQMSFDLNRIEAERKSAQEEAFDLKKVMLNDKKKKETTSSLRKRMKDFYKGLFRKLKTENSALILKNSNLLHEIHWLKSQVEDSQEKYQQAEVRWMQEIQNLRVQSTKDKEDFELMLKAQLTTMNAAHESQLCEVEFHNQKNSDLLKSKFEQEQAKFEYSKNEFQKRLDELSLKYQQAHESRFVLENEHSAFEKQIQMKEMEMRGLRHEISHLKNCNDDMQVQLSSNLRVAEQLLNLGAQQTEEIQTLKSQLNDKSYQMVNLELELRRHK